jgi:hypothetical protein
MKAYVYLPTSIRPRCVNIYNELELECNKYNLEFITNKGFKFSYDVAKLIEQEVKDYKIHKNIDLFNNILKMKINLKNNIKQHELYKKSEVYAHIRNNIIYPDDIFDVHYELEQISKYNNIIIYIPENESTGYLPILGYALALCKNVYCYGHIGKLKTITMFYNHKNVNFKSTLDKVLMHMQRINK